jgi:transposase-like protein
MASKKKTRGNKAGRPAGATSKKAAKKSASKRGTGTGKRYSEELRKEILAYVDSAGRGGITEAKKKWGVSYIALKRWMDGAGGGKPGRKPKSVVFVAPKVDGRKQRSVQSALVALKAAIAKLEKAL